MSPPNPQDIRRIPALQPSETALVEQSRYWQDSASLEARQIASGKTPEELARESQTNEHGRTERFRNHFERLVIAAMYGISAAFAVVAFTWVFNLVAPVSWHYATDDQVTKLQNIVTGGIIGVLVAHMKRRIGGI